MIIKTLWRWRRSEEIPELMEAWDEYAVDENPDGWREACERSIASWGGDLYAHRYVDLDVSLGKIVAAFGPPSVKAQVVE